MHGSAVEVVVAGHICIDVIPTFAPDKGGLSSILVPGKLVDVGPAVVSTGGSVSNTGLALHRLGVRTGLMGKVGADLFGRAILDILRGQGEHLAAGMIVDPQATTSYSVVLSLPGADRIFLHCTGANDTYRADDIAYDKLDGVKLLHFGYPPLMRCMYSDGGKELATLLQRVRGRGVTTSLDLARPDPASDAGKVDWVEILSRALPHVDVFLPSFDEILFMLDREKYEQLQSQGDALAGADEALLEKLSGRLLEMGSAVVGLKLGDQGLYVRTTSDAKRLAAMGAARPSIDGNCSGSSTAGECAGLSIAGEQAGPSTAGGWVGREILAPCFRVEVVGTTGSGDCTIAGFLTALIHGESLPNCATAAVAVGACSVEAADATGGVPTWHAVQKRISANWPRHDVRLSLPGWTQDPASGLWIGPKDWES